MRHSYPSTPPPPPLPAVLAEMKASPTGGPGLRSRQRRRALRWPGLARCFHRSPDRCQAGSRPAGHMDHLCKCESVLQPRNESQYFHLKVVLVAQNSHAESAKLMYNLHLGRRCATKAYPLHYFLGAACKIRPNAVSRRCASSRVNH